jgi:hypothetical protein
MATKASPRTQMTVAPRPAAPATAAISLEAATRASWYIHTRKPSPFIDQVFALSYEAFERIWRGTRTSSGAAPSDVCLPRGRPDSRGRMAGLPTRSLQGIGPQPMVETGTSRMAAV